MNNLTYIHYELNFSSSLMQLNCCYKCRPRKQPRQPTTISTHPICNSTMICFSNSNSSYRRRTLQLHMRSVFIPVLFIPIPIPSFQKALAAQQQSQPSTVQMYHQQQLVAAAQPQTQQTASSSSTSTHRPAMLV